MRRTKLMFFFIIFFAVFLSCCSALTASIISAELISHNHNIYCINIVYQINKFKREIPIKIVNYEEKNIRNAVWILHGYKPQGDPYFQSPAIIINNWSLQEISGLNHDVFFIPDMGMTIYSLCHGQEGKVSDIKILSGLVDYFKCKLRQKGTIFVGISTGAEGAIKLASCFSIKSVIVCLSGTFDYFSLPKSSDEYKIHEKIFKNSKDSWISENPVDILRTMKKTRVYVFSEENSIFRLQAESLIRAGLTNIDIIDKTALGKGFSHNWDFWKNPGLYSNLTLIFGETLPF